MNVTVLAEIVIALLIIIIILQAVIISGIAGIKKQPKTQPGTPQRATTDLRPARPDLRPGHNDNRSGRPDRPFDRNRDRNSRGPSPDPRNRPQASSQTAEAPAAPTTAIDSSLRDINLKLKNAERDMDRERKRLQGGQPQSEGAEPSGETRNNQPERGNRDNRGDRDRDRDRDDLRRRSQGGQGGPGGRDRDRDRDRPRGGRDGGRDRGPRYGGNRPYGNQGQAPQGGSPAPEPQGERSFEPSAAPIPRPPVEATPIVAAEEIQHGRVTVKRRTLEEESAQSQPVEQASDNSGRTEEPVAPPVNPEEISFGRR